jgi:hypothetical protein
MDSSIDSYARSTPARPHRRLGRQAKLPEQDATAATEHDSSTTAAYRQSGTALRSTQRAQDWVERGRQTDSSRPSAHRLPL